MNSVTNFVRIFGSSVASSREYVRIGRNTEFGVNHHVRKMGPLNPNRGVGGAPVPIRSPLAAGQQSHFYLHIGAENSQSVTLSHVVRCSTTRYNENTATP